jgi:F-type H+-transporting ATPase subunit epsilon
MSEIRCTVTTPEKTEIDVLANSVVLPLYDGQMGILPGHSPMVARLGYGVMQINTTSGKQEHYVDGGFVQVTKEGVAVLTDKLQSPKSITAASAEEELRTALAMPSNQPALMAIKNRAVERARSRKHVAESAS